MNRRAMAVGAVATLLFLVIVAGGGGPASGNTPEGSTDTGMLNVTPSDDLPAVAPVTIAGTNFFPRSTVGSDVVSVAQCVPSLDACGPATPFTLLADGSFGGPFQVVRMLVLTSVTADCGLVYVCEVQASGGGFAAHHLTFSTAPPTTKPAPTTTTTTRPATTTTAVPAPTTTIDRRPVPGVTIPPTTRATVPRSTTTLRPTTTTSTSSTTTTVPPPPTPAGPSLIAVTPKHEAAGPPGGGLRVEGSGYSCPTVYFFFDGVRVGSDTPDAGGNVSKGGLSVPGDAGTGRRRVTSSCDAAGATVLQTSAFDVLPVSVHRPAFVTSLPLPSQVSVDPGQLLASAAVAVGAILLVAFPYELFNSTMEENYDEIRAWFGLPPRKVPDPKTRSHVLPFFGLTALSAAACGFLSPDFGLNRTSAVLFVGMFVALIVMAVVFSLPADIGIRSEFGEWGKLNFLPGSVVVSIVLVLLSRVLHFQPGYFYGALAGLAFRSALSEGAQGKWTAANWIFSLFVSVGAFFLRVPVSAAAARPGSSIWWIGLEICLSLIFLWGVEGLAVAMLPMRFLDGRKVFRWSKTAWAGLFFLGLFATVHILLRPGSGYVGSTTGHVGIGVMSLFAAFGALSVGLWAYFRFRPARWARSSSHV